jgi:hypothetical protein
MQDLQDVIGQQEQILTTLIAKQSEPKNNAKNKSERSRSCNY